MVLVALEVLCISDPNHLTKLRVSLDLIISIERCRFINSFGIFSQKLNKTLTSIDL